VELVRPASLVLLRTVLLHEVGVQLADHGDSGDDGGDHHDRRHLHRVRVHPPAQNVARLRAVRLAGAHTDCKRGGHVDVPGFDDHHHRLLLDHHDDTLGKACAIGGHHFARTIQERQHS